MSFVRQQRSGDTRLPNFFEKVTTEGDAASFAGAESGSRQLIRVVDSENLGSNSYRFTLTAPYLVGAKQLIVAYDLAATGVGYAVILDRETMLTDSTFNSSTVQGGVFTTADLYYEEESNTTVVVHNLTAARLTDPHTTMLFAVPHTAVAASSSNKILVDNQGDNTAIELLGDGDGIIFRSPSGRRFVQRVDDSGNITMTPL